MSGLGKCARVVSPYLLVLLAITTLGPLQFGSHLAELNTPQDVMTCRIKTVSTLEQLVARRVSGPSDCIAMSEASFAAISAMFTVGGLMGALAAGRLTSLRGRLLSMRVTAVFFLVGSVVETVAGSVWVMCVGRLLVGVGAGASTVVVPLYISEMAPPSRRGFLGALTQISINLGILGTQTLGYFWSREGAWRRILAAGVVVAAVQALGLLLVPESPVWLVTAKGDVSAARRTLQRVRGSRSEIDDEIEAWRNGAERTRAEQEGLLAEAAVDESLPPMSPRPGPPHAGKANVGFSHLVRDPLYRPALVAIVSIMFAQQLCGINSIIMYSVSLLKDLLPTSSALVAILISVVNLGMTVACSPLPDMLGRKTCILASIVGQGISSLALAVSILRGLGPLSVVSALLFVAFFAVGLGPVPFMLASELVGPEAVGATQSWALGANYLAAGLVAYLFPILNTALNSALGSAGWVYFLFAAFAAVSAIFVSWKVPETRGKRDADEVWGRTPGRGLMASAVGDEL